MTGAGSDVESAAGYASDLIESANMGLRDVQYVNVVANAGAIGRRIIAAKNFDVRRSGVNGLQDAWNQVRFSTTGFSALARSARDVEIAKGDIVEPGVFA